MSFFFHSLACPRIFDLTCPHWGPASTLCRRNMERHEPVRACVHPPAEDERAATNQGVGGGSGEVRENRVTEIFTGETRSVPSRVQVELTPRDFEFPARDPRLWLQPRFLLPLVVLLLLLLLLLLSGKHNNGLFVRFHCCCKNSSSSSREETVWLVLVSKIIPIFRVPFLGPKFPRNGSVTRHANNGRIYGRRGRVGDKGGRGNGGNGD